jgi:F0F1-type ATP synthase membrane subunit b/b'
MINFKSLGNLKDLKDHLAGVRKLRDRAESVENAAGKYATKLEEYSSAIHADLNGENEVNSTVLAQKVEAAQKELADRVAELFDLESTPKV